MPVQVPGSGCNRSCPVEVHVDLVHGMQFVDDDDDRGTGLDESMSLEQRVRIENELAAEKAAAGP